MSNIMRLLISIAALLLAENPTIDPIDCIVDAVQCEEPFEELTIGDTSPEWCWTIRAQTVCVKGVNGTITAVPAPTWSFDCVSIVSLANGLGGWSQHRPTDPYLLFSMHPPAEHFFASVHKDVDGQIAAKCWFDIDDVGTDTPYSWEPTGDPDYQHMGMYAAGGFAACAVYGVVDNVGAFSGNGSRR